MKIWQMFTLLLLGIACLGLSIATVATSWANQRLQQELQAQQIQINSGILGQRGQQLSSSIMQDMGNVALTNENMRQLLAVHGYNVRFAEVQSTGSVSSAVSERLEED